MTREVRRRKPSNPQLSDGGAVILRELRTRNMSLSAWLDEQGFDHRFQRVAAEIIAGRVTGERNTDASNGGTTRALMIAMSDDFGIGWEWMARLTPSEVARYRGLMRTMATGCRPTQRERLKVNFRHSSDPIKALEEARQSTILTKRERLRRKLGVWYFRSCVYFERCPACLAPATYYSDALSRGHDGKVIRSQSVLFCHHGCYDGKGITAANILKAIMPATSPSTLTA